MPTTIDLTDLDTTLGYVIQVDAGHSAGFSVSSAGDVNGDGIDDIIVGSPYGDAGGSSAGGAYVVYGRSGTEQSPLDLTNLATVDGFFIQGDEADDRAGFSVSSAGDVNGDGIDDIIIGAPYGDDQGTNAGEAYVIYGTVGTERGTVDLSDFATSEGFILQGYDTSDNAGFSVSSAGDVNGDGIDDVIVGAPYGDQGVPFEGLSYVVYGTSGTERGTVRLSRLTVDDDGFTIQGDYSGANLGHSVSSAGDVNGDGIDDIIVGAPYAYDGSGGAYVIYGVVGGDESFFSVSGLRPTEGFAIQGGELDDSVGFSVSSAGDVNGDGIDDIIIGAPYGDDAGANAGMAYVIYGTTETERGTLVLSDLTPADGFIIQGDAADDQAGRSVSSAGDVNGDGIDDIIVGTPYGDDGGSYTGEAYVIYGTTGTERGTVDLSDLDPADGFIIQGDMASDYAGFSVSSAGDVNGDGIDDIIVGSYAGDAYVIYGSSAGDVILDDAAGNTVTGTGGTDVIIGVAGTDTLDGGLQDDLIIGGFDSDTLIGGNGNDILIGDNNALIAGADVLTGGVGDDLLEGGGGADTFVFATQSGNDTIGQIDIDYAIPANATVMGADFVSGVDLIMLDGFAISTGAEALALVTDIDGVATFSSEGTEITFAGLTAADLSINDFIFI